MHMLHGGWCPQNRAVATTMEEVHSRPATDSSSKHGQASLPLGLQLSAIFYVLLVGHCKTSCAMHW